MKPLFKPWDKISRYNKETFVITEKIDGTNGVIFVGAGGEILAGSRNRWLNPGADNFGFAKWVEENRDDLLSLGEGYHYGEWYGLGIQRGYGLEEKRFALFNTGRWGSENKPVCCDVVPVLEIMNVKSADFAFFKSCCESLQKEGSRINQFKDPEGICIYATEAKKYYKMLIENDELHKFEVSA